nr:S-adenosylhomocysteine hydrolase [Vibrio cholerae]
MTRKVRDELYNFGLHINQIQDLLLWHFDSEAEAAEYFGVTAQTVKNWKKKRNWPLAVV